MTESRNFLKQTRISPFQFIVIAIKKSLETWPLYSQKQKNTAETDVTKSN